MLIVQVGKTHVTGHNGIQLGHQRRVGNDVARQQLLATDRADRQIVVWVARRQTAGRKMLGT